MKKLFLYLSIACFAFSYVACASSDKPKTTQTAATQKKSKPQTTIKTAPSKTSFADVGVKDIEAASKDIDTALKMADDDQLDSAIAILQKTVKSHPKAFIAHYDLGLLLERKTDIATAKAAYEAALNAEPNFYIALLALVRIDIRNGNTANAIQVANLWLTKHSDIFNYHYAKIEALIADKQYEDAISLCRSLLKTDEANARLRYYLASAEFEKKRFRLADFIIGESLDITPNDPDALFLRARIYDALRTEDVALIPQIASTLDEVLKLNSDHLEALWMRANIYYNASNYKKAEEMYRHMLRINPNLVGAHINLANTLKTVDRGPEAETLLLRAKELDPYYALVDFSLGTLYLNFELIKLPLKDMERLQKAKQYFESAETLWTSKNDKDLAKGYIRTTNDAIETLQAMLDAEALFGPSTDESDESTESSENSESPESPENSESSNSFRVD